MAKKYHVTIYGVEDETGNEELLANEIFDGLTLLGDIGEGFAEIVMNDSLYNIAAKLGSSKTVSKAMKLSMAILKLSKEEKDENATAMEDLLTSLFEGTGTEGGVQ